MFSNLLLQPCFWPLKCSAQSSLIIKAPVISHIVPSWVLPHKRGLKLAFKSLILLTAVLSVYVIWENFQPNSNEYSKNRTGLKSYMGQKYLILYANLKTALYSKLYLLIEILLLCLWPL